MVALRCIDQANVSQELLPDVTVPGFRELGTYFFIAPLDGVDLYIDEAPAEAVQVGGQSGWRWTPGFYAGVVVAELLSLDRPAFRRHPVAIIDGNDRGVYGQQQAVHG